ncbi:phospholipase D family protein [Lacicoccus qingdaonensis]|uniref:phospholipase D n=1 Tax=Lacicoccus qingdaonensis TaxID=576118 RepID=A0A1G9F8Z9_9BACL|nr:phospholipase D family protein [Salinicoccus qingdaonensis]SDK84808.1 Phosphatidylserine/phosphatidylglycerophosphate/cardiolipin synthase [Salinicoccus qingdaonensis]
MKRKKKVWLSIGVLVLVFLIIIPLTVGLFNYFKPTPENITYESDVYSTDSVEFLYDLTYADNEGGETHEQEIFDEVYRMIEEAEEFLLIDMFLFNDDYDHGDPELDFPPLSEEVSDALVQKKSENPDLEIIFITDPINTFYKTYEPPHIKEMKAAGISVHQTDLAPLRDSNPLYSSYYRAYLQWFGSSSAEWLPNALRPEGPDVNLRSYFSMLNFKANHRKTIMHEDSALVMSANPHDASFYHSNIAFKVQGGVLEELMHSERAVLDMAGMDTSVFDEFEVNTGDTEAGEYEVRLVTEGKVKKQVLDMVEGTAAGDTIQMGMFYISDREVINALKDALNRDVHVQMILDVNQDAFGNEKIGIPNRPVASELMDNEKTPEIRWYESHGEQYHAKFLMVQSDDEVTITGGSSNFTRRNIEDYNLETNLTVTGSADSELMTEVTGYYDRIWNNEDGTYTADYDTYKEDVWWKNILYRIQEDTGLSTF